MKCDWYFVGTDGILFDGGIRKSYKHVRRAITSYGFPQVLIRDDGKVVVGSGTIKPKMYPDLDTAKVALVLQGVLINNERK